MSLEKKAALSAACTFTFWKKMLMAISESSANWNTLATDAWRPKVPRLETDLWRCGFSNADALSAAVVRRPMFLFCGAPAFANIAKGLCEWVDDSSDVPVSAMPLVVVRSRNTRSSVL